MSRKILSLLLAIASLSCGEPIMAQSVVPVPAAHITRGTQWDGKNVGVLGDSMSAPRDTTKSKRFYNYLTNLLGITPYVYAVAGNQMKQICREADRMYAEHPDDLDAILIWGGTNDYNSSLPIGEFYTENPAVVNVNGSMSQRMHRTLVMADSTFCGRINLLMLSLKERYPDAQIVLLTPLHRGFARFGDNNIQPPEEYANACGHYIDDYVAALRRAGEVWSVPVIDLFSISGFYPIASSYDKYIQNVMTDRLHPNDLGHYRLARILQYQLPTLPL